MIVTKRSDDLGALRGCTVHFCLVAFPTGFSSNEIKNN